MLTLLFISTNYVFYDFRIFSGLNIFAIMKFAKFPCINGWEMRIVFYRSGSVIIALANFANSLKVYYFELQTYIQVIHDIWIMSRICFFTINCRKMNILITSPVLYYAYNCIHQFRHRPILNIHYQLQKVCIKCKKPFLHPFIIRNCIRE